MTHSARTVLPTDLVALVSYDGKVFANEAMTRDRIGTQDSPSPLEAAFEQWLSFATGRHTFISVKGPTLRGLVSARKRGSKLAWEIDCLIAADDSDVMMSLLDQMTDAAGKSGALRIFLRLPDGAPSVRTASSCGFAPYLEEIVYHRGQASGDPPAVLPEGFRRRAKADAYPLFLLYTDVVPQAVRRFEGATFSEWQAAQEKLGSTSQYVLEREGRIIGWTRVAGDGDIGRFDLLARPEGLDDTLAAALAKVANRETIFVPVPHYDEALARRLDAAGFEPGEAYSVSSRRTVREVKMPKAVPVLTGTPTI